MSKIIRIGTRKSALALIQTELIAEALGRAWPDIEIEIVTKDTQGDKILDKPLQEFGGKGVFVSELEQAILDGTIDLAVHSAKDIPMELAPGLALVAVSEREDPRDVLVTLKERNEMGRKHTEGGYISAADSRQQTAFSCQKFVIGTSSPRRQLLASLWTIPSGLWPKKALIRCETLRGNVPTRLRKLKEGQYDGIILAAAGLNGWAFWKQKKKVPMSSTFFNQRYSSQQGDRG